MERDVFHHVAERPEAALAAGRPVDVRHERWRTEGAERLRIVSPEPRVEVVTRYRPAADGTLTLTVIRNGQSHDIDYDFVP